MDVQAPLTPLNETFVSEYNEHETAAQKAEAKTNEAKLHVAEMAKHEEELKAIYITYLVLDFCAKRFPNFSEGRAPQETWLKIRKRFSPPNKSTEVGILPQRRLRK